MMKPWNNCADLLDLFAVPAGEGRARFEDLCDLGALLIRFGSYYDLGDLERVYMKEQRLSPLVFWSCQKRAVRSLLAAGGDTLRALGVPVEGEPATVHALAVAVAKAQAEGLADSDKELYTQLMAHMARVFNGND